jgi:hypothetical protein
MRNGRAPLPPSIRTVLQLPPEVRTLALAFGRIAAGQPPTDVMTALMTVVGCVLGQAVRERDAIDPLLDLFTDGAKTCAREVYATRLEETIPAE